MTVDPNDLVPFGTDDNLWAAVLVPEAERLPLELDASEVVVAMYHLAPFDGHLDRAPPWRLH